MGVSRQSQAGPPAEKEKDGEYAEGHTFSHNQVANDPGTGMLPDPEEPDGPRQGMERATAERVNGGSNAQHEEEQEFGQGILGFPTERRPDRFRREQKSGNNSATRIWLEAYPDLIGDQVNTEERLERVYNLLATWRDLFVTDVEDMPVTDIIEHRIPTYSNTIPKAARVGLFTPEEIKFQQLILPKMERAGIITRCESPWAARTKFPRRKNGKLRMVHAFIPINSATIKSQYPMKRLEPLLREVSRSGMTCFFTADAANGYWAVPLHLPHAYKTAFYAYDGQYCYLRMGQGLTGGPATYSRLKDIVTGRIPGPSPEPALSDIGRQTIFGHFMDDDFGGGESFDVVEWFLHHHYFPRLAWSGLTLTPAKVVLFTSKFNILGHARDGEGIRPSEDKLAAFREWPAPRNEDELMRFIYTLPFFRAFIPGRADLTSVMKQALIQEMVQRTVRGKPRTVRHTIDFYWGIAQQEAFDTTKAAILKQSTTAGNEEQQYHLATDASNTGAGGVLFQIDGFPVGTPSSAETRPHERIIMFMSFQFLPAETQYKTTEREALAVLKSLEECRWIVQGLKHPVKLYTDHSALVSLLNGDDSHGRIARWQYRLSEYVLDIKHVPGKELAIADGLSRIRGHPLYLPPTRRDPSIQIAMMADPAPVDPLEGGNEDDPADAADVGNDPAGENEVPAVDPDWELGWEAWTTSAWYADIVKYKITGRLVIQGMLAQSEQRRLQRQALRFTLLDGDPKRLLYWERSGKLSSCLLPHEVEDALRQIHDLHGHFAEDIVMQKAIGRFYWPNRRLDIYKYCRSCVNCQMLGPLKPTRGLLPILQLQPLDMLGIDFIGPFRPISNSGARYICLAVDYFSRYLWAKPLPTATSANALKFLQQTVTENFGWPRALYSDNGSHFTGGPFRRKLEEMRVRHILAPITHPSSVGLAERYVQIVLAGLRAQLQTDPQSIFQWDQYVSQVVKTANTRTIRMYGYTPSKLLLGINARHYPMDDALEDEIRGEVVANAVGMAGDELPREEDVYTARLAAIDEIRERATTRRLKGQQRIALGTENSRADLERGDLVLLRQTSQDNQRGHKLEPRWTGPYRLAKIAKHGQSGWIEDLHGRQDMGRYHLNDLKKFVPCTEFAQHSAGWQSIAETNEELRQLLLRPRRHQNQMEQALEEQEHREAQMNLPSKGWFRGPGDNLQGYGDEGGWAFWGPREIDLQRDMGLPPMYRNPGH